MEIVTFTVFSELIGPLATLCKSTRHRHGPLNLAHIFLNLAPPMSPAYSLNLPHTKDAPQFVAEMLGGGGEKTGVAQVNNWPFVTSGYFRFGPEMFGRYSGKKHVFSCSS